MKRFYPITDHYPMLEQAKVRGIPIYYSLADCLAALPNRKGGEG